MGDRCHRICPVWAKTLPVADPRLVQPGYCYSISDGLVLSMVTEMLNKAFTQIPDDTQLILHSDQGWQYQHKQYQRMLTDEVSS
ncbi:MAG: hypothetical protein K0S76_3219 [Herbinix sp.]|nr:hypothetical protein [Herbinix sp.]